MHLEKKIAQKGYEAAGAKSGDNGGARRARRASKRGAKVAATKIAFED
jgi:hypothetical protein